MTTINAATLTDLRDVLVARRALEGEIARLSALNAWPDSITEMRSVLARNNLSYTQSLTAPIRRWSFT